MQVKYKAIKNELNALLKDNRVEGSELQVKAVTKIGELCYNTITPEQALRVLQDVERNITLKADNYININLDGLLKEPRLSLEEYKIGILMNFVLHLLSIDTDRIARARYTNQ